MSKRSLKPSLQKAKNYDAFGMFLLNRLDYCYGFLGQEMDEGVKGAQGSFLIIHTHTYGKFKDHFLFST